MACCASAGPLRRGFIFLSNSSGVTPAQSASICAYMSTPVAGVVRALRVKYEGNCLCARQARLWELRASVWRGRSTRTRHQWRTKISDAEECSAAMAAFEPGGGPARCRGGGGLVRGAPGRCEGTGPHPARGLAPCLAAAPVARTACAHAPTVLQLHDRVLMRGCGPCSAPSARTSTSQTLRGRAWAQACRTGQRKSKIEDRQWYGRLPDRDPSQVPPQIRAVPDLPSPSALPRIVPAGLENLFPLLLAQAPAKHTTPAFGPETVSAPSVRTQIGISAAPAVLPKFQGRLPSDIGEGQRRAATLRSMCANTGNGHIRLTRPHDRDRGDRVAAQRRTSSATRARALHSSCALAGSPAMAHPVVAEPSHGSAMSSQLAAHPQSSALRLRRTIAFQVVPHNAQHTAPVMPPGVPGGEGTGRRLGRVNARPSPPSAERSQGGHAGKENGLFGAQCPGATRPGSERAEHRGSRCGHGGRRGRARQDGHGAEGDEKGQAPARGPREIGEIATLAGRCSPKGDAPTSRSARSVGEEIVSMEQALREIRSFEALGL
ncbi:hypothetical protein CERSUDRAFT_124098 [Gelatoporia subvermispora B]|uniref:Uncharacterized protein n=1 Tax=Ceriporiopsis subvermispora (strain B) TaxID=914234 RepID=M2RF97_CERS8|nr:hypothetical protein CERSUDRAFT_124098 [Gelatoporia subvermispora B]